VLKVEKIKGKEGFIGVCQKCDKIWFIEKGENPKEYFARPAEKVADSSELGSAGIIQPSSFKWHLSDFKFFKTYYFKGADLRISGLTKVSKIKPTIDLEKIYPLGQESTIRIDFLFTLQLLPDIGEISFKGKCLVHSENPERVYTILEKKNQKVFLVIKKDILRSAYPHARNFAKSKGHNLPPVEFIMTNIGDRL
jgi:hypothetical protein